MSFSWDTTATNGFWLVVSCVRAGHHQAATRLSISPWASDDAGGHRSNARSTARLPGPPSRDGDLAVDVDLPKAAVTNWGTLWLIPIVGYCISCDRGLFLLLPPDSSHDCIVSCVCARYRCDGCLALSHYATDLQRYKTVQLCGLKTVQRVTHIQFPHLSNIWLDVMIRFHVFFKVLFTAFGIPPAL